jgi:hypothetical protein
MSLTQNASSQRQTAQSLHQALQRISYLRILSDSTTSHIHMLQQSRQRLHLVLTTWASVQPGNPVRVLRRLEVLVELFQGRKVESGAKVTIVPVVGVLCILGCHVLLIRIKSRRFLVSDLDHRTRDSFSCSVRGGELESVLIDLLSSFSIRARAFTGFQVHGHCGV